MALLRAVLLLRLILLLCLRRTVLRKLTGLWHLTRLRLPVLCLRLTVLLRLTLSRVAHSIRRAVAVHQVRSNHPGEREYKAAPGGYQLTKESPDG
jgi:hypothetical protein